MPKKYDLRDRLYDCSVFILKKLSEKTTWAGIGIILGTSGISFTPSHFIAISVATMITSGVILIFWQEKKDVDKDKYIPFDDDLV